MTLGRQTAVLLGLLLLILTALCAWFFRVLFHPLFMELEQGETVNDGTVVSSLLLEQADGLSGAVEDWATWDETWAFMDTRDSGFLDRNLDSEAFRILDIHAVALVDTAGSLVAGLEGPGEDGYPVPLGRDVIDLLSSGVAEVAGSGGVSTGFALAGGRPCVLAIRPILHTAGTGPHNGGLVFVRDLTPVLRRLRQQSAGLVVTIRQSSLPAPGAAPRVSSDADSIRVDIELPVLFGPGLELSMSRSRDTYAAYTKIIRYSTIYLVASGLLFSLVTLALLHKLVVSRLAQLMRRLQGTAGGPEAPDGGAGLDEVGQLEKALGPLLGRLEAATADLRESERRNAALIEAIPDFMVTIDREGIILSVHPGYGNDQVIPPEKTRGMTLEQFDLADITPGEVRRRIARALDTCSVEKFEFGLNIPGSRKIYEVSMVAFGQDVVLAVIRDETQRKHMEDEASRVQRLESLGMLAGGMAHDLNNSLAAILGNIEVAEIEEPGTRRDEAFHRAHEACEAARCTALRLLTFSSGGDPVRRPVELGPLVGDVLMGLLPGSAIVCDSIFEQGLPPIEGDPDMLSQLVGIIVTNSLEAMGSTGVLCIRASACRGTGDSMPAGGNGVLLSISDTGGGIPASCMHRIFEPYFTTKPDSAGLGLSVAYSIVKRHGGSIEVAPSGQGTEMRIWLPACDARPAGGRRTSEGVGLLKGSRVLVMDDDPLVVETVIAMLGSLGLGTGSARSGSEAVQKFAEAARAGRPYDVVFLDLVVPGGMGGLETLSRIRRLDPSVKAVVSSGYSADAALADHKGHGFDSALRKPFSIEELREALSALREDPPASP